MTPSCRRHGLRFDLLAIFQPHFPANQPHVHLNLLGVEMCRPESEDKLLTAKALFFSQPVCAEGLKVSFGFFSPW
jgi:hypothetical protein